MDDEKNDNGDADITSTNRTTERQTRRFAWSDDLHRLFVASIFDLGLKHASPKALLAVMEPTTTNAGITTEHLKSHLQKYRLNYDKSRSEFLASYDTDAAHSGHRRGRTTESMENSTIPITTDPQSGRQAAPIRANTVSSTYPQLDIAPQPRLRRADLRRLAQQNAAMAFASQSAMSEFAAASSVQEAQLGDSRTSDVQLGILTSLLSPQLGAADGSSDMAISEFSLSRDASSDIQLQMTASEYYNQTKRLTIGEGAPQNATNAQQRPVQQPRERYTDANPYVDRLIAPPFTDLVIGDDISTQYQYQQQLQYHHQLQHFATSQARALQRPPWDAMDVDDDQYSGDRADLFGFLRSSE